MADSFQSSGSGSFIPNYPQADFLTQIAQQAEQWAQATWGWAQTQFNNTLQLSDQAINNYLQASQKAMSMANFDLNRYQNVFAPQEDALIRDANTYASGERIRQDMGAAESGQEQASNAARMKAEQDLQSFGIDPSSGRYAALDRIANTQGGAAAAGAADQARLAAEKTGRDLRQQAIQIGQNKPANVINALNQYANDVQGAVNTKLATDQVGVQLQQAPVPYLNSAAGLKYPPLGNQQGSSSRNSTPSSNKDHPDPASQPQDSSGRYANDGFSNKHSAADAAGAGYSMVGGGAGPHVIDATKVYREPPPEPPPEGPGGISNPDWSQTNPFNLTDSSGSNVGNELVPSGGPNPLQLLTGGNDFADNGAGANNLWDEPQYDYGQDQTWDNNYDPTAGIDQGQNTDWNNYDPTAGMDQYNTDNANYDPTAGMDQYNPPAMDQASQDAYQYDYSQDPNAGADYNGDWGGGYEDFARGGAVRGRAPVRGSAPPMGIPTNPDATTGGFVPRQASPSLGQQTDDVPANLNAGEFVLPRDVVKWKGEEFFQKMISQARKNRVGAPGKATAGPAHKGPPRFSSRGMR